MSTTATSNNATTTATSGVPVGSSLGALKYNINSKIGWRLGDPTPDDIILYSDMVFMNGGYTDITTEDGSVLFKQYDANYPDQTFESAVSNYLTYNDDLTRTMVDATTYAELHGKNDGLFGMSFLPWSPMGLKSATGNYYLKSTQDGKNIPVNPMRREVFMIKLFTIMKIFGISVGGYFLFKLIYKLATRKK